MGRLACYRCGRAIYSTSPIQALFWEERTCPRCGHLMNADRRAERRRRVLRRWDMTGSSSAPAEAERRREDRRRGDRRTFAA